MRTLARLTLTCCLTPLVLAAQSSRVRVEATPILTVAATADDGALRFSAAAWATRLANGDIAIADLADGAVRLVTADGRTVRTLGQRGAGPGEYQAPIWIGRCSGDSIVVWDMVAARATVHAPRPVAGAAPVTRTLTDAAATMATACASTGEMAFATRMQPRRDPPPTVRGETPEGGSYQVITMSATMKLFDGATVRATLQPQNFGEYITGRRTSSGGFGGLGRPLGALTSFAFVGDRLVIASADSGTVVGHELDGREAFRFTVPRSERPATPADYRRAFEPTMAMLPARNREMMSALAEVVPPPAQIPPFWRVLGDPIGVIWLVTSPEGGEPTVLRAYSQAGAVIGEVSMAGSVTPFEVGRDYILGRRENGDGEQEIVVFRLTRPDARR